MLGVALGRSISSPEPLLGELVDQRIASRVFARDTTLWGPDAEAEAAIRLGWTDFEADASEIIPQLDVLRAELRSLGVRRIVLCGMGGSSLAPAVISRWAGVALETLDSTHPAAVRRTVENDLAGTAVVVSSKSGGTIETLSHLAAFERAFARRDIEARDRVVVVTDPGSSLQTRALNEGYRVFTANPNVGGRFSALTAFGLVPASLAGADVRALVSDAQSVRSLLASDDESNPALRLAAAIAAGLPDRFVLAVRDKRSARWGLARWIEQLVAESTGKGGQGVLPIALTRTAPEFPSPPATVLRVKIAGPAEPIAEASRNTDILTRGALGAQLLLWETATAVLGHILRLDPFDQPDVESAKVAAREALARSSDSDEQLLPATEAERVLEQLGSIVPANGYLAIQAFLDPEGPARQVLEELRDELARSLGVPVALGWGPNYLHSTGQLHKGGPALGAFLQLTDADAEPYEIPGSENGFETLIAAQARGDREVLTNRGRPVLALKCENPAEWAGSLLRAVRRA